MSTPDFTATIGLCECGCGQPAPLAAQTNRRKGHVRGEPVRFVSGHNRRPAYPAIRVDDVGGCWEWQWKLAKGYGQLWLGGRYQQAHRVLYERTHGPIPEGLELDHLCRNRACVNPAHLEPVTHAENIRRAKAVTA